MIVSGYQEYALKNIPDLIKENVRRIEYALIDDLDV